MSDGDRFDLSRFVTAQERVFDTALSELRAGCKQSHWMWFVFPQLAGLGSSSMAKAYAIRSAEEARAYLAHPLLGPRLREGCQTILALTGLSASDIFGYPDDLKLRSSMTLFSAVSVPGSAFDAVLDRYFDGERDARTIELLHRGGAAGAD